MDKLTILRGLKGNPPISLNELQQLLAPHLKLIEIAYWAIWCFILVYLFVKYLLPFLRKKKDIYY